MWDSEMTTLMTSAIGHPNLSLKAIGITRERNISFCDIMFKVPLESAFVPQCDTKIRKMLFNSFYKLCLFLIPWHVQGIRQTMMASFFPQMISSHRLLRPHANELLPSLLLAWCSQTVLIIRWSHMMLLSCCKFKRWTCTVHRVKAIIYLFCPLSTKLKVLTF